MNMQKHQVLIANKNSRPICQYSYYMINYHVNMTSFTTTVDIRKSERQSKEVLSFYVAKGF